MYIMLCVCVLTDGAQVLGDRSHDEGLRGKVQHLKRMMEERKLRRQEKRGLRAPYQWPRSLPHVYQRMRSPGSCNFESPIKHDHDMTDMTSSGKSEPHPESGTPTPAPVPFSTGSATAIEQESVLV